MRNNVKNLSIYPFQTIVTCILPSKLTKACDMNKAVIRIPIQETNKGLGKLTQYRSTLEWCQPKLSNSGLYEALYHVASFPSSFMK